MKPTAEQAIKYLSSKTNDRTFLHKDNKLAVVMVTFLLESLLGRFTMDLRLNKL